MLASTPPAPPGSGITIASIESGTTNSSTPATAASEVPYSASVARERNRAASGSAPRWSNGATLLAKSTLV
jgi:hypothetical protein